MICTVGKLFVLAGLANGDMLVKSCYLVWFTVFVDQVEHVHRVNISIVYTKRYIEIP